jgi:predicted enzyme related to lactoylglutathione lyase
MKYVHTNIIARDWKRLSKFYQDVFQCVPVPPQRDLKGKWVEEFSGVKNASIQGEHLLLPGFGENGPTLEIFSYNEMIERENLVNGTGFAHIAFAVDDVADVLDLVQRNGGTKTGEPLTHNYPNGTAVTFVYCKDIEGNIIELQKWS